MIQSPLSAASFKNGTTLLFFFPFLPALMEVCLVLGAVQLLPAISSFFCAVPLGALPLPGCSCGIFSFAATTNVGFSAVAGGLAESKLWFIKYPEYLC